MKVKRVVALFFIIIMLFAQGIPVSAQKAINDTGVIEIGIGDDFIITPDWVNVNNIRLNLSLSNGTINCVGVIDGVSGTTSISATFTLERKTLFGWSTVETWESSSNSSSLVFSGTASGSRGNTYRLSVVAVVVRNGNSETVRTSVEGSF